jgi:branched-chain amino acid transport system ATP-binding protein
MESILNLQDVHTFYGKSHILHGITLEVHAQEIICLLGRNGVGKTTTLRSIMGLTPPQSGQIFFHGQDISHIHDYLIPRLGIGYVPQGRHIFPDLTVRENLKIGIVTNEVRHKSYDEIFKYFPILKERLNQHGGTLSGGEQQMLAIARALVPNPTLILLDEPSEGLMPKMVKLVSEIIQKINRTGVSILWVEQKLVTVLGVTHRVHLISKGRVEYQATPEELAQNREIQLRYLGVKA